MMNESEFRNFKEHFGTLPPQEQTRYLSELSRTVASNGGTTPEVIYFLTDLRRRTEGIANECRQVLVTIDTFLANTGQQQQQRLGWEAPVGYAGHGIGIGGR